MTDLAGGPAKTDPKEMLLRALTRHAHAAPFSDHLCRGRRRLLSTVVDLAHLAAPAVDPDHLSSVAGSKADLLKSYRVTPPVQPWPDRLHPRRLAGMIRRQADPDLAVRVFLHAEAFHPGFSHTYLTYHALLDRLARARAFPQLESVLFHLRCRCAASNGGSDGGEGRPFRCGEEAFIIVIRSYGLAGKPSAALRTFLSIRRDFGVAVSVRAFNALLNAMVQNRRYDLVAVLFKNCRSKFGVLPNVFTCNILIKALCKMGNIDGAVQMLDEMPHWGMVPNVVSYTTVLGGYCARGDLDGARRLFGEILDRGWSPDATTYTVLMEGYCLQNRLIDAVKVMDEMIENGVAPNDVTYSVIIEAYCKAKRSGEALNLLHDMLDAKYMPSPTLCCKVIDVLCEDGRVEDACDAWKKLLKKNCTPDNAISSTLIYWLCKKGKVWEARKLFAQFEKGFIPSLLTFNTLISGMCENEELQEAGRLWDDMEAKKCSPNSFTYNVLIKGFCRAGMAKEAVRVLKEMLEKGYVPDKFACSTLVDGLYESDDKEELTEVLHLVASCEYQLLNEDCWDVFVRKVVVNDAGSCGLSLEQVMYV